MSRHIDKFSAVGEHSDKGLIEGEAGKQDPPIYPPLPSLIQTSFKVSVKNSKP